ncbi:MAG: hypothetical protein ACXVEF_41250 [Polyangiales bacterium]
MITLGAKALAIVALAMAPGDRVTIDGSVATSWDGSTFDASTLFDPSAGGLGVESYEKGHVTLRATGAAGSACLAAGVASPCLVPRLPEIAHARMLSTEELRDTLRGELAITVVPLPPPVSRTPLALALFSLLSGLVALSLIVRRRLRATPLGRVSVAASAARRATANDPTLGVLRDEIERLVDEARGVDRVRRACAITLRRTRDVTHAEEREELRRLEADVCAAEARLADIAAALRLVPLRAREHRDLATKLPRGAAMESVTRELELRERALAEVE